MSKKPLTEAEYRQHLHDNFLFFLHEVWRFVGLPKPSLVQCLIALWLCLGPRRRVVKAFRGASKTWITIVYVLWRLHRNPNERILLVSQSRAHSWRSLYLARQWIDLVPFLRYLAPHKGTKQRDAADQFDVGPSKEKRVASVTAMGITGQLTGERSSLVIADDVETLENTITRDQRMRLRHRVTEFANILLPGGDIVYLGTPHHEETLYDDLVDHGYAIRAWPVQYPSLDEDVRFLCPELQKHLDTEQTKPGDPVWPERFGHDYIVETRLDVGRSVWSMQFMLKSSLADEELYPLKLADLVVFAVNRDKAPVTIAWGTSTSRGPTAIEDIACPGFGNDMFHGPAMIDDVWAEYHGTKAYIDPAGAGKRNPDEMAWAIAGQLHGYLYAKCVDGVTGGATPDNLEWIVLSLKAHGATSVAVETNFGGDMLIQLIQPIIARHSVKPGEDEVYPQGWTCHVKGVHSSTQKETRIIDRLEPVMNQHRLIVDRSVASDTVLMRQLTRITRERGCLEHDDRLEALSGVVAEWQDVLHVDADLQAQRKKDRDFEEYQRRVRSRLAPKRPTWIQH